MSTYNSRLRQPMPLHRKSETDRRGHKNLIRSKEARAMIRPVKTRLLHTVRVECPNAKARRNLDSRQKARLLARGWRQTEQGFEPPVSVKG